MDRIGSQMVVTAPWYGATVTEGSKGVVFNAGSSGQRRALAEPSATNAVRTYTLAFRPRRRLLSRTSMRNRCR
jgi:hypothetical protein